VIHAEGELQAAATLSEAAGVLSATPASLQLRYLQTLSEIGADQSSTIVFPLPIDLLKPLLAASEESAHEPGEKLTSAQDGGELTAGAAAPALREERRSEPAPRLPAHAEP
jgi:hypothetical protein